MSDILKQKRGKPDPWATGRFYKCRGCGNRHEVGQRPCKQDDYFEDRKAAFQQKNAEGGFDGS